MFLTIVNTYFLPLFAGIIATLIATPIMKYLAFHAGVIDTPSDRKIHCVPIPHLGGIAIFTGLVVGVFLPNSIVTQPTLHILMGGSLMVVLGILDDAFGVRAVWKLGGQILIASFVFQLGIQLSELHLPGMAPIALEWAAYPLTVFFIVGLTNTINLIDGLDGLAASISSIALATIAVICFQTNHPGCGTLAVALLGGCLGFLKYNFPPARIFMGDSGSMLLGFSLATLSISGVMNGRISAISAIPILILAIPILDVVYAIFRRKRLGQPVFSPDKGHLHHVLLDNGLTQKQVTIIVAGVTSLFAIIGYGLFMLSGWIQPVLIILVLLLILSGVYLTTHYKHRVFEAIRTLSKKSNQ